MLPVPDVCVYETEHCPLTSVHDVGVKDPVPLDTNETVPPGVVGVPDVSVTVAVQVVGWLIATEDGLQAIAVEVVCKPPMLSTNVPKLVAWVESPP